MAKSNANKQYELFQKYWEKGAEEKDLSSFKLANNLKDKLFAQIDEVLEIDLDTSADLDEEDQINFAYYYSTFSQFMLDYVYALSESGQPYSNEEEHGMRLANRSLEIRPSTFEGAYLRVIFSSFRIMQATAGKSSAIYKGQGAADSIVGTAFNLIGKGITLGVTAAGSQITRGNFTKNVQQMIDNYAGIVSKSPVYASEFIEISEKMFKVGDYCEEQGFEIWRQVYRSINLVDLDSLDYSNIKEEFIDEFTNEALEIYLLADAKV